MQNNDQLSMAQASKISSHSSAYASANTVNSTTARTKNDISSQLGVNYQGVHSCLLLYILDIQHTPCKLLHI